jgi:histidinol-phosphate aminotransferase
VAAIKKNLSRINRYPESGGFYLKKRLAKFLNVQPSNIVLGNGSDELIDIIVKTFVEEDEHIVTADGTFLEYKIISQVKARIVITVPLKYFKYDLDAIKRKITKKTKVVFISNPNNPTGTYVTKLELDDFIRDLPPEMLLVLDEAYDIFIDVDDFPNSLGLVRGSPASGPNAGRAEAARHNVIVLKTFSKSYGLAGLRVGYAVANPVLASFMEIARQPFNVNLLAQVAATAALDDDKFLKNTRKVILEGKSYLYDALTRLGIAYVPSVTNFILIDVGRDGVAVFKEMLKYGVIVRDMRQYGFKNFIRVTIGTRKENERFIKVLKKVL